ncbi:hypothetical protein GWI33_009861, partial [Rhynchophorus ferrugineus]
NYVDKKN